MTPEFVYGGIFGCAMSAIFAILITVFDKKRKTIVQDNDPADWWKSN
jgi:hypothetical protein